MKPFQQKISLESRSKEMSYIAMFTGIPIVIGAQHSSEFLQKKLLPFVFAKTATPGSLSL